MKEHKRIGSPVGSHFKACGCEVTMDNIKVLITTYKSVYYLMTLEALFIDAIKPKLNTKDEFRSRALTIKI